jgi:hypothetical protein
MSSDEKSLEEKVKQLTKMVEMLINLETKRMEAEKDKSQEQVSQIDKEALKEELREVHLGELVRYAIKKNLIPRGGSFSEDKNT